MRIIEHLSSLSAAMRELSALRWGVPSGSPRVLAESLFAAAVRDQLYERICADGAAPLYVRLLEEGCVPLVPELGMEEMASWLASRSLLVEAAGGVSLPAELVVLEQGRAEVERGWSLTLLSRCDEGSLRRLAEAVGLRQRSRRLELVLSLHEWLLAAPTAGMEELGAVTQKRLPLPVRELTGVSVEPFVGGAKFLVSTRQGLHEVAAREVALAVGKRPARAKRAVVERVSPFEFPAHGAVGAVVTVTTRPLAERMAQEPRLAGYLTQRLDQRRFVVPAEVPVEELEALLGEVLAGVEVVHG
jgi:hypothetical protein